jgi:branched-chain amino acid transport system substrate-binding protein
MTVSRRKLLKFATGAAALTGVPGVLKADQGPIVIGEINSYIDELDYYTSSYRRGVLLAVEEVNQQGGVRNREFKVSIQNDYGKADEAVKLAYQLVNEEKVAMLCGSFLSDISLAISTAAKGLEIPFLAGGALTDRLTLDDGNEYTFRMRPSTYMQSHMLAKEAARLPVNKWLCIAPDYEFGYSAVENFKTLLSKSRPDIEWQGDVYVPLFNADVTALSQRLQSGNYDAVFNATFSADLAKVIEAAQGVERFKEVSVVSMLSGEPEYLRELKSRICQGWIVTGYPWEDIALPSHQRFVATYQSRFDESPTMASLNGYLTIKAAARALQVADDLSSAAILKSLNHLYLDSPFGVVRMRALDHQSSFGTFVGRLEYKDGKNRMKHWYYADGSEHWPARKVVERRRPPSA